MKGRLFAGLLVAGVGLTGLASLTGCGSEEGLVEVYWQFQDGALEPIYPQGARDDTCEFLDSTGLRFNLRVQLTVAENDAACSTDEGYEAAGCTVVVQEAFECNRGRGVAEPVPISGPNGTPGEDDPGYLMFVEALIEIGDESFVPSSSCLLAPGPRVRQVFPGRITDLEVAQFVFLPYSVGSGDAAIDTELCRPGASQEMDTETETDTGP
ncbi:hypothetical protein PPSIR1_29875 [Plesiocystis pacifica SIR-1]|uniref:Lipoprotein n=1 Tax=Plesiocystis pacifica SIR-1 TaxID=391625 RepID=A6FYV4_9BACT|nr:hypothetical protein [Plesiocystis pacifica]EDM81109.1 hypothetical protein PPSIR1_29875 [Plesiocystis pacifica SIR-1]